VASANSIASQPSRAAGGIRANNLVVRADTVTAAHLDIEADQVDCARAQHRGEIPNCAKSSTRPDHHSIMINSNMRAGPEGPTEWTKSTTGPASDPEEN
jgi:hypothetical protein